MEIKVDVDPHVWQKFEQMSGDVCKDRSIVLSDMIEKAHAEFVAAKEINCELARTEQATGSSKVRSSELRSFQHPLSLVMGFDGC
jgi:hypothetical protein